MIRQPFEISNTSKKIRMLIAGYPGIGKTTLALSAPSPLLIDVDQGLDRVQAKYHTAFTQPAAYEELLSDLTVENLRPFETIVIDTGGQLIKLMAAYVIKQNAKNGQRDGSLSLKGYGAVGREFQRFVDICYYTLKKNVVIVFHAKEEKDGENTRLRILVEGQTKDNVWQPMDLGGFIEMQGNRRTIGFTNCERYYAKGTHGIHGTYTIPELDGQPNNFLTELFETINNNIKNEALEAKKERDKYNAIMEKVSKAVEAINNATDATNVLELINKQEHVLTSQRECKTLLNDKIKEIGVKWNATKEAFEDEIPSDSVSA